MYLKQLSKRMLAEVTFAPKLTNGLKQNDCIYIYIYISIKKCISVCVCMWVAKSLEWVFKMNWIGEERRLKKSKTEVSFGIKVTRSNFLFFIFTLTLFDSVCFYLVTFLNVLIFFFSWLVGWKLKKYQWIDGKKPSRCIENELLKSCSSHGVAKLPVGAREFAIFKTVTVVLPWLCVCG